METLIFAILALPIAWLLIRLLKWRWWSKKAILLYCLLFPSMEFVYDNRINGNDNNPMTQNVWWIWFFASLFILLMIKKIVLVRRYG